QLLNNAGILSDVNQFKRDIYAREKLSSTGFEMGVAIPHAKSNAVKEPRVAIGISKQGIDFDNEDGNLTNLIFMIATTDSDKGNTHLNALAKLSAKLVHPDYIEKILNTKTADELVSFLNNE
ncbi:MAG TPA: PTS fructose transporter subunit IIABC, partial [Pasteurellaceae bacterium]|nr:PTS fructose transporter subunit IIABC [Pasteurellaceae bacterium]